MKYKKTFITYLISLFIINILYRGLHHLSLLLHYTKIFILFHILFKRIFSFIQNHIRLSNEGGA